MNNIIDRNNAQGYKIRAPRHVGNIQSKNKQDGLGTTLSVSKIAKSNF